MRRARGGAWIGRLLLLAVVGAAFFAGTGRFGKSDVATHATAQHLAPRSSSGGLRARVVRVVDGDTIVVSLHGRDTYVRYIGVDTPETVKPDTPVQCFGPEAHEANDRLVYGHTVRLVLGQEAHDIYGRLLAYVYLGRRMVNAVLARRGLARTLTIPPNDRHAPLFARLQQAAGRAGRGLWGACPA